RRRCPPRGAASPPPTGPRAPGGCRKPSTGPRRRGVRQRGTRSARMRHGSAGPSGGCPGLGHRLFERGTRGVSLTAEGHRFREYAVQALDLWRSYREEHPDPAQLTGRLAVFATVTACQALLPDLLAPFRRDHPQVLLALPA